MRWLVLVVMMLIAGCDGDGAGSAPQNPEATFPKTFLWGAAIAGFQSEPGCPTLPPAQCEDRASDWYQWVTDPEIVADAGAYVTGEPLANGPGMRETFREDFARARDELGLGAIRLSIEWSRLFPDGAAEAADSVDALAGHADPAAVAYYRELFAEMKRLGLVPLVTLNHYTLPLWIHDGKACHQDYDGCADRGWLDRARIVRAIGLYAGYCARTFGDTVDLWATLNEPFATVLAGYIFPSAERSHPPGVPLKIADAIAVLENQIFAHARMVDAVRAEDQVDADRDGVAARVGVVVNIAAFAAADQDDPAGPELARHASWFHNEMFLEGVANGRLDSDVDGVLGDPLPELVGRLDWIGVNYYTRLEVVPFSAPIVADYAWLDFLPSLEGGFFQVYPDGLHEALVLADRFGLPLIVTENGALNPEPDAGDTFLVPHLRALYRAIAEGIPVEGYFYWTLVDNYEWNHGMNLRLGLYALAEDGSKARTLRPIGRRYGDIVKARGF